MGQERLCKAAKKYIKTGNRNVRIYLIRWAEVEAGVML